MAGRSRWREEQYESRIDVRHTIWHCSSADSRKDSSRDTRRLLSAVVVDDDESVRESLPDLLREFGFAAQAFSSAQDFLSSGCAGETSCLILDVAMPGMSGPQLQQELKRLGQKIPIIFITGRNDEAIRTRVIEQGAASFLLKPFSDAALLEALKTALRT
jgi:FixJ family two-component response regulator